MKSNFVYYRFNRSSLVGHFYFYFYFLVRKIPFAGIELTSQRVRRLLLYFQQYNNFLYSSAVLVLRYTFTIWTTANSLFVSVG